MALYLHAYFESAEVLGKWCEEGQESQDLPGLLFLTQASAWQTRVVTVFF
jgi:hypothetical protein